MSRFTDNSKLWAWRCRCDGVSTGARPITSAHTLKTAMGDDSRLLKDGLMPYLMVVPEFTDLMATTMGSNSLLTDSGRISSIQTKGEAFYGASEGILLRTAEWPEDEDDICRTGISNVDFENRRPPAFYVFDQGGDVMHRIDILGSDDAMILAASCASFEEWRGSTRLFQSENKAPQRKDNVVSLMPHLQARRQWSSMSFGDHLDDILKDGGPGRLRTLRTCKPEDVRKIDPHVLEHVLLHLVERRLPLLQIVTTRGLMQSHYGTVDFANVEDGLLFLHSGHSMMVLDLDAIAHVYSVMRCDAGVDVPMLEIYDTMDRCIAVLACDVDEQRTPLNQWRDIITSLPSALNVLV